MSFYDKFAFLGPPDINGLLDNLILLGVDAIEFIVNHLEDVKVERLDPTKTRGAPK